MMNSLDKMEDYDRLARLCEAKDAEIVAIKTYAEKMQRQRHSFRDALDVAENNLDEAQAKIEMQEEALDEAEAFAENYLCTGSKEEDACIQEHLSIIRQVISATSETVAAWRTKETEPLRREVAMALAVLMSNHQWHVEYDDAGDYEGSELYNKNLDAINHTQATALAYERGVENRGAVKALEDAANHIGGNGYAEDYLRNKVEEIRKAI